LPPIRGFLADELRNIPHPPLPRLTDRPTRSRLSPMTPARDVEPMTMTMYWRIELLGGLRARLGDRVVERFPTRKTAALLAYLAYHRGAPAPREELVELLWPRVPAADGRASLRKALSALRRQLEAGATMPAGAVIDAGPATVRLRAETTLVDALEFRAAADAALRERDAAERARRAAERGRASPRPRRGVDGPGAGAPRRPLPRDGARSGGRARAGGRPRFGACAARAGGRVGSAAR
jgi:hypothetical protein